MRREAFKARKCCSFLEHRGSVRDRNGAIFCGLQRRLPERLLEGSPTNRIALDQRRAQGPFVHFGGQKQLVKRSSDREGDAVRMPSRDGLASGPIETESGARDPCAPTCNQAVIAMLPGQFEYRARAGKKQIAARQAPRILERQRGRDVQSSLSGAMRMPRSSRISPS